RVGCGFCQFHQDRTAAPQRPCREDENHQRKVGLSTARQGARNLLGLLELFGAEHEVDNAVRFSVADDMCCEFSEFLHDVSLRRETVFAAAWRLDGLLELYAIVQA